MIRLVAFAMLAFLLTVGQASAECAWVLWQDITSSFRPGGGANWQVVKAVETRNACLVAAKETAALYKANGQGAKVFEVLGEPYVTTEPLPGTFQSYRLHCLPDTVDPREAKGR
jgi:hypothetical protein